MRRGGQIVLFGGIGSSGPLNDTWVWDGADWVQKSPASSPPARADHAMTYDQARGQVVLFGGSGSSSTLNDTWVWDGSNWILKFPNTSPPPASGAMVYHSGIEKVTFFQAGTTFVTWLWDGTDWTQVSAITGHGMAYDLVRGRAVLSNGLYTYLHDGFAWTRATPATAPPTRQGHAMAFDSARAVAVLFGGQGSGGLRNDTWTWDGADWVEKTPLLSPPARRCHALAYDAARGEVVLFGGLGSTGPLNDTWVWDGANWTQKFPAVAPPARGCHAMAYDGRAQQVVLFGGTSGSGSYLSDTWVWNGTNWAARAPTINPSARAEHAMAYDGARGRVMLSGGRGSSGVLSDTWVWDGANWVQRYPTSLPSARASHAMTYDAAHGQVLLVGGLDANGKPLGDVWAYRSQSVGPTPVLVAPGSGSGVSQEYTFVFDHSRGWTYLQVVNALMNFWLDGRQACYVAYLPASRALYLVDDAGNAGGPFVGGLVVGRDTHSIGNSQCTIHGQGSWVQEQGTQLWLHLRVEFAPSFAGTKIAYLAARDQAGNNSGWQRLGVWKVPGAPAPPNTPQVLSATPAEWTGTGAETLEVQVMDPDGAGDLAVVNVLVNDWLDGRQACYLAYAPALNAVFLVDDAGNAGGPFAGGFLLGTPQAAANSQCVVYGEGSSAVASGTELKLRLRVEFRQPGFRGHRVVYAAARDQAGNNSGWQAVGRWSVP